jgi:hypothetical protein
MSVCDAYRIIIDNSRVMLQIVASLTDDSKSIIYNRNMLVQAHRSLCNKSSYINQNGK